MSRIVVMRGLPASGKTSRAMEILNSDPNAVRVNKDDLRIMMFGINGQNRGNWSYAKEKLVIKAETALVAKLLEQHKCIIIDDTNLNPKHVARWQQMADEGGHKLTVEDMKITVEECVERDKNRPNSVGESVILGMAGQYGLIEGD